jgi:hypothetical protein
MCVREREFIFERERESVQQGVEGNLTENDKLIIIIAAS